MNNKKVKITALAILIALGAYGLYYKVNDNIKRVEKLEESTTNIEERIESINESLDRIEEKIESMEESLEKIEEIVEKNGKKLSLEP